MGFMEDFRHLENTVIIWGTILLPLNLENIKMKPKMNSIEEFCETLKNQTIKKAQLYDGVDNVNYPRHALALAVEELREISSAITRNRLDLAKCECIDLAHCAYLISQAITKSQKEG